MAKKALKALSSDRGTPLLKRLITAPCGDKHLRLHISAESSKPR